MKIKLTLLVLFFLALNLLGEQGAWRLYQLTKSKAALKDEIEEIKIQNASLVRDIENLNDPTQLERLIREEWGYIREGERLLEIPQAE